MKNNNLTEIVFILDRSGSMSGLEQDTIGGYNSLLKRQKDEEGEAVVTTVLFDDQYEIVHDHTDIKKVRELTEKEYYARGCTALLDAIGKTINHVANRRKYASDRAVPGKTLVVITTDGYENASCEFLLETVNQMIKHQKEKYGWEFLFLGANIDAVKIAASLGINKDMAVTYKADSEGTKRNYEAVCNVASSVRGDKKVTKNWKTDIEEYMKQEDINSYWLQ